MYPKSIYSEEHVDIELLAQKFCRVSFSFEGIMRRLYFSMNANRFPGVISLKRESYHIPSLWLAFNRIPIEVFTLYIVLYLL